MDHGQQYVGGLGEGGHKGDTGDSRSRDHAQSPCVSLTRRPLYVVPTYKERARRGPGAVYVPNQHRSNEESRSRLQMGYLEVVIPPDFIPEETSGDTMVPEGGTARVSCRARGIPPPRVMWKREDGQEIVVRDGTGAKSKVHPVIQVPNQLVGAPLGTDVTLECYVESSPKSINYWVKDPVHPVIQVPNQLVGAPLGTDVTLECYVESSPKSINYWVKDPGELIIPSEHHEMAVRQKSMFEAEMSMTIKNIRREDLGSYICVAKNSLGDVESKIRLYEIPGTDKHIYQYPDERTTSDDEYGTEVYDDFDDQESEKSNRVPDRANKCVLSRRSSKRYPFHHLSGSGKRDVILKLDIPSLIPGWGYLGICLMWFSGSCMPQSDEAFRCCVETDWGTILQTG
ncbi:jg19296 [Pararge aegeria aegeria]|uniref:Jg19296 protein n=1 Tax=Pararge aegeria aegeria TaxID=348720 RepID=A0A8S4RLK2_9NEOP|nr:jg19296 [Pararge aegeria aegeria]